MKVIESLVAKDRALLGQPDQACFRAEQDEVWLEQELTESGLRCTEQRDLGCQRRTGKDGKLYDCFVTQFVLKIAGTA